MKKNINLFQTKKENIFSKAIKKFRNTKPASAKSILPKAIFVGFLISVIFSQTVFAAECDQMSGKLLRLHILANSDSDEDQELKLKVRDEILAQASNLFVNAETKEEAKEITQDNINQITALAQKFVYEQGYNYKVNAKLVKMRFNTRHYDDITLPAGEYDALRITIGAGEGHNWWCVMFPPMCFSSAEAQADMNGVLNKDEIDIIENEPKYEFKFKTAEIFNEIVEFFKK
ncbi:stage II sporulation protein R [Clostridia bacterium]|nr:stage II sporulation protein R [Clostridia bacterium]